MYATQMQAYRTAEKTTESGRDIEASSLMQAAMRLKDCQRNWNAEDRDEKLRDGIRLNQMIWSIFQGELLKADNPLPKQLKEDILSLSVFIDKKMIEVLAFPSPEKLDIIINLNLNLAAGLKGRP